MTTHSTSPRRLLVALILLAVSLLPYSAVSANAASTTPNGIACSGAVHCYGEINWPGATYGARTIIQVNSYAVNVANNALTQELWLVDTTQNPVPWAEVGYVSGEPNSYGYISYFYAYMPPGSGQYWHLILLPGGVPSPDWGGHTDIKITRNTQPSNMLLVAIVGAATNYSATFVDAQGGTTWAGNLMQIGSELIYNGGTVPTSNGSVDWQWNRWQDNTGGGSSYHFQTTDGQMVDDGYQHPSWGVHPGWSSTGGQFLNYCCVWP